MDLEIKTDCSGIDWVEVRDLLKNVGMAYREPEVHRRAFEASHTTVFVFRDPRLIGFGRAISDGEYQAAIYDVAVHPETQGMGVGKLIIEKIKESLPHCNLLLYATPGMEGFYAKLGFRLMTTGMALFTSQQARDRFTKSWTETRNTG